MSTRTEVISVYTCCTNNALYISILMLCTILIVLTNTFNSKFFIYMLMTKDRTKCPHNIKPLQWCIQSHDIRSQPNTSNSLFVLRPLRGNWNLFLKLWAYWRLVIYWLFVHQEAYARKGDTTYLCTYPSLKFHFIYFLATSYPGFYSPYFIKCNLCR
jgi:hypothetical protein